MKLIKFLVYSFGFFIGLTFAFCANTNYDQPIRDYLITTRTIPPKTSVKVVDQEFSQTQQMGKKLFRSNCASCHNKNMVDALVGPALKGVTERWEGREELLYEFIRNSSKVIASGDSYATELYNSNNQLNMTSFPNLEDKEIEALLSYIESR